MLPLKETLKNKLPKEENKSTLQRLNRVALFTNARDEKNLKEWAAHHILLGFDSIFIFDHKSVVPLKKEFANFDKRVTIIDGSRLEGAVKMPFMNWALEIARRLQIDKFIYLDADEYLVLNGFSHVKEFLQKYNYPSLAVNWLLFGSNMHKEEPTDSLLIDSYTKSDMMLNFHVKTFVSTKAVWKANNPHFYNLYPHDSYQHFCLQGLMKPPFFKNDCKTSYEAADAYIAHYINQSEETFRRRKMQRPQDDTGTKRLDYDIQQIHNQHNDIDNLQVKTLYSSRIYNFLLNFQDKEQDSNDCLH